MASFLLRWRRLILLFAIIGGVVGLASGLRMPRRYVATATFLPQATEASLTGLRAAASQLGIGMASGGGWGPALYVELLRSSPVLQRIAVDTISVAEQGGRRVPVMDLFGVTGATPQARLDRGIQAVREKIESRELPKLGAVEVEVTTRWPSVSVALAERLIRSVNQFNLETRKSQAAAEREFAAAQARAAEDALRQAEHRMQVFLQGNRAIGGSPELTFERDRLQREVGLRQQLFTSLLQNHEEARLREVRDIPVITVIEQPRMPYAPEPRNVGSKVVLVSLGAALLAVLLAFISEAILGARHGNAEARAFFEQLKAATPRFIGSRI